MDPMEVLKGRRSVRSFEDREVPHQLIEDIIDAARLAPTAINIQPWEFVVVTDKEMLKKIGAATDYGKFIAEAPACVVVCCKDTKYYLEDGSAATENILLAAKAHGLGSCWVAGDKKYYVGKIKDILGIPGNYKVVSLIPIGYAKGEVGMPRKRKLEEVLHWERF